MAATIKDLARETGLGYATISAYLNGANVRPKNKQRIEQAIEKLGYVRNEYARGLKTHRSMTIGVLIPELSNVFSTVIISEVEDVLRRHGYGTLVCDCRSDREIEKQALAFLQSKMVDGVIVMPISTDGALFDLLPEQTPAVAIDRITAQEYVSHVLINNRAVSVQATRLLLAHGHRAGTALLAGPQGLYTADERRKGYEEALASAGCLSEARIYPGEFTVDGGYLAMKRIIRDGGVTAVFVTNYEMTIGAIIAIHEMGCKIPDDFSFIGFDNHELSRVIMPKLAMVNQPLRQIGREAAVLMLERLDGKGPRDIILSAAIEPGDSIQSR